MFSKYVIKAPVEHILHLNIWEGWGSSSTIESYVHSYIKVMKQDTQNPGLRIKQNPLPSTGAHLLKGLSLVGRKFN